MDARLTGPRYRFNPNQTVLIDAREWIAYLVLQMDITLASIYIAGTAQELQNSYSNGMLPGRWMCTRQTPATSIHQSLSERVN